MIDTLTEEYAEEYRFFGIFIYRTMSKESGLGIKKLIGPMKTQWSDVLASMLHTFPADRLEKMSDGIIIGIPSLTLQILTNEIELTEKQAEYLKQNLLLDKFNNPVIKNGNIYQISFTKVYTIMIDTPREHDQESAEIVGHQLLSGGRDCELLEIVRVHKSSGEAVRQFLLTGTLEVLDTTD